MDSRRAFNGKEKGERNFKIGNMPLAKPSVGATACASIGVALFANTEDSVDGMPRMIDIAMYQVKAAGRNTLLLLPRTAVRPRRPGGFGGTAGGSGFKTAC